MNLIKWAEKLREVDAQTGRGVAKVKVMSVDGTTWNTWEPPFSEPADFVREVQELLNELAEEWPPTAVQVLLTAVDAQGVEMSTCVLSKRGKNKAASGALLGHETRVHAEAMDQHVRTTERLLGIVNNQLRLADEQLERAARREQEYQDYIRLQQENALLREQQRKAEGGDEVGKMIAEGLKESLPALFELLSNNGPALVRRFGGAAAVAAAMNGAVSASKES